MADIKQIEVSGTKYNIAGAAIVLEDNGGYSSRILKVKTSQIDTLVEGQLFLLKLITDLPNIIDQLQITGSSNTVIATKTIRNLHLSFTNLTSSNPEYILLCYYSNGFNIVNTSSSDLRNIKRIRFSGTKIYEGHGNAICISNGEYGIHISGGMDIKSSKICAYNRLELCVNNGGDRIEITDNQTKIYGNYGSHAKFNFGSGTTLTLFDDSSSEMLTLESNTITGHGSMQLRTSSENSPVFYIEPYNGTKIYMPARDGYFARPELSFADYSHSIGTYTNRPIYLGNPNEDASEASSSIAYNADEDCIEFVFE